MNTHGKQERACDAMYEWLNERNASPSKEEAIELMSQYCALHPDKAALVIAECFEAMIAAGLIE